MQANGTNLTSKNICLTESNVFNKNNNIIPNEISKLFNKVYDSNFLLMINELSISILNFHKLFNKQSKTLKNIFNEIENKNNDLI